MLHSVISADNGTFRFGWEEKREKNSLQVKGKILQISFEIKKERRKERMKESEKQYTPDDRLLRWNEIIERNKKER